MKRAILPTTDALLVMLILAPIALAQEETTMMEETTRANAVDSKAGPVDLPPSGGPVILLPAAALLLGSGVLTYAILRRS